MGPVVRDADVARVAGGVGAALVFKTNAAQVIVPDGVKIADGLTEDEAVAVALWNNAAFQEALADLGLARADLLAAGQLSNPTLSVLFPLGPKQLEFTAKLPMEILWVRPARQAVAKADAEVTAGRLVQNGLDLARDVRLACADVELADARLAAARETARLSREAVALAEARLRAGDASAFEVTRARAEAGRAAHDLAKIGQDGHLSRERLRALLGLRERVLSLDVMLPPADVSPPPPIPTLLETAFACRPDLRACEMAIEAAARRGGLAVAEVFAITAALDANRPPAGLEMGPGIDVAIPILNQNQAGATRARAELERAARHYVTVHDQIQLEVQEAAGRLDQARAELDATRGQWLPAMELAEAQARQAIDAGEATPLALIEVQGRLAEARARAAEAVAALRGARAQLDRAVGRRLTGDNPAAAQKDGTKKP